MTVFISPVRFNALFPQARPLPREVHAAVAASGVSVGPAKVGRYLVGQNVSRLRFGQIFHVYGRQRDVTWARQDIRRLNPQVDVTTFFEDEMSERPYEVRVTTPSSFVGGRVPEVDPAREVPRYEANAFLERLGRGDFNLN